MDDLIKYLRICSSKNEVWELMKDKKLSPGHEAKFGDEIIILRDSHNFPASTNIPTNDYGLVMRLVSYFRFNGYMGHINYGSGEWKYLGYYLTLWNDLNEIKPISGISEINEELIEQWIRSQFNKGIRATTIMVKFHCLTDWINVSSMLPHFLTIDSVMIYDCPSYSELDRKYSKLIVMRNSVGGDESPKYPLHLLLPVLQAAIDNIINYTNEIELLMAHRHYLKDLDDPSSYTLDSHTVNFLKKTEHVFQEPSLMALQEYCKNLGKQWKANPATPGKGPRTVISEIVERWQAANLIILGFFTASRSQEISRQPRNIKMPKTKYHEMDQGYKFTRVIWKTARFGKMHTTPLPPLGMQTYRNLSRHSEQMDGEKMGTLQFNTWSNLYSKMHRLRMKYIIMKFSQWVHSKDVPHLTPHQLRHAMASLMNHLNDHNGLMIAAKLLGHDSATMTMTYQAHMETIVLNKINYIANTNKEVAVAFREYEVEGSMQVVNNTIMPALKNGEVMLGPGRGIMQFTGDVVHDPESWFNFYAPAIKDGLYVVSQTPTCLCFRPKNIMGPLPCQRGIKFEDYSNVPVQPAACQGSSCVNSLFTEQNCEMLKNQTQSVKDLAPDDLREMASEWFSVVGDGLEIPDKKVIAEYEEALKKKKKVG